MWVRALLRFRIVTRPVQPTVGHGCGNSRATGGRSAGIAVEQSARIDCKILRNHGRAGGKPAAARGVVQSDDREDRGVRGGQRKVGCRDRLGSYYVAVGTDCSTTEYSASTGSRKRLRCAPGRDFQ